MSAPPGGTEDLLQQLGLVCLEVVLVASLLLTLFRLRGRFGLAPIHTTLGVISQMSSLLSASVYVRITPDLVLSPGSTVLFPAVLFVVLFVYVREDARQARRLIYGLVAANFVIGLLGLLATWHLRSPAVFNPIGLPEKLFLLQPRLMVVGTLALLGDTILIVILYELLGRFLARRMFLRVYLSMAAVLALDTLFFVTGSFYELPQYGSILLSDTLGKCAVSVLYAAILTVYLQRFDVPLEPPSLFRGRVRELFQALTYREKYEALREQASLDGLTGVYNRAFLDGLLPLEVASALRSGRPLTVMLVDVDHFKSINDTFGHAEGDAVLVAIARAIRGSVRASDVVARYGGEEFAVVLPETSAIEGRGLAERVRAAVPLECRPFDARAGRPTTVTIGVATLPDDATSAEAILRAADERLYAGKHDGRDRVIAGDAGA